MFFVKHFYCKKKLKLNYLITGTISSEKVSRTCRMQAENTEVVSNEQIKISNNFDPLIIVPDNQLLDIIGAVLENHQNINENIESSMNEGTMSEHIQAEPPEFVMLEPISFCEQRDHEMELAPETAEFIGTVNINNINQQTKRAENNRMEISFQQEVSVERMEECLIVPTTSGDKETDFNDEEPHNTSHVLREAKDELKVNNAVLVQKNKRLKGLAYLGCHRKGNKITSNIPKDARRIGSRCHHISTKKKSNSSFLCGCFSEEDRRIIFEKFWKLESWAEKKMFVKGSVTTRRIKRRRKYSLNPNKKREGRDILL